MRTSYLPKKLVASFLLSVAASSLIFGCTAKKRNAILTRENQVAISDPSALNINTADAAELEALPHIGPALAQKIIEHRTRYGPYRRPEDILIVEGISEKRFGDLRKFIRTE